MSTNILPSNRRFLVVLATALAVCGIWAYTTNVKEQAYLITTNALKEFKSKYFESIQHDNQSNNHAPISRIVASSDETKKKSEKKHNEGTQETGLILFTTWVESEEKKTIHVNVMNTWLFWKPIVKPLYFYSDKLIGDKMREAGWLTLPVSGTACGDSKIPIFRDMFLDAIKNHDSVLYGYANGDITFDDGIATAIEHVMKSDIVREKPVMVLVRRFNVDFANRTLLTKSSNFTEIMVGGHALNDGSSDGFFTNKLFPWKYVPDVVVGRIGIGMWMVSYARAMNATIIDITKTVRAIHMTTKSGNHESHHKPNKMCNHDHYHNLKIAPSSWGCGFITCSDLEVSTKGGVVSMKRKPKRRYHKACFNCTMDLTQLLPASYGEQARIHFTV